MRYVVFGLAFALLATGQVSAATSCWGRLNRFFGLGWGDGYHVGSATQADAWIAPWGEPVHPAQTPQPVPAAPQPDPEPQVQSVRGWFIPNRNSAVHHPSRFVRLPSVDSAPVPAEEHSDAAPPSLVRLPSTSPERELRTKLR